MTRKHYFFFASFDPAGYITVDKPPCIISGKPVIALGGFSGGDNTLEKLKQMVQDRKIRFFLLSSGGGFGGGGGSNSVAGWIREHSTEVPAEEWQSGSSQGAAGMGNAQALYKISD